LLSGEPGQFSAERINLLRAFLGLLIGRPWTMDHRLWTNTSIVLGQGVGEDVGAHAQGGLVFFIGVVVYFLVFPAIAQVAFVGIKAHQAALVDQAVALRGLVVVFMDLGQALGKLILLLVDGVGKGSSTSSSSGNTFFSSVRMYLSSP
jgi:hypothetical protein